VPGCGFGIRWCARRRTERRACPTGADEPGDRRSPVHQPAHRRIPPAHGLHEARRQLRVVHDVFGHAALGVGFDLQSEFATWLQCRTLFSAEARPAAFCELVGAVTAYVVTGEKPSLQAKLPPARLIQ
jgi:hypothetical protein